MSGAGGFSYFPGCSLHATAKEYDESMRALAARLDLNLKEIDDWCCCGATPAHAIDPESARVLGLWNLAHAARRGKDPLLTGCASCFSRLRAVRDEVRKSPAQVAGTLEGLRRAGLTVEPDLEVFHIAQVLGRPEMREKLASKVTRPLTGLKVACYYGCLLTRPRGPGAVDDAEDPNLLEDLARLAGADPIEWPLRLDCCGASMALPRADLVQELSARLLVMAHERGAQVVMVACPLCHSNLDFGQAAALRPRGHTFRIPVLYLTQLLGLALGIPEEELGFSGHFVPVKLEELLPGVPAEGASRV